MNQVSYKELDSILISIWLLYIITININIIDHTLIFQISLLKTVLFILFSLHYIIFYYILINFIFTIKETNNEKQNTVNRNNIYPSHSFLKLDHHIKITIVRSLKVLSFIMRHTKMFNSVNYFRVLYMEWFFGTLIWLKTNYELRNKHLTHIAHILKIDHPRMTTICCSDTDLHCILYYFYPKWLIGHSQSTQEY